MSPVEPRTSGEGGLRDTAPTPLAFDRLVMGVDNIRHDVFFSPRWQESARQYLMEQIAHHAQPHLGSLYPSDSRRRSAAASEFRTRLEQLLREALHRAKEQNNIEVDLLARLGMVKWLLAEMQHQFSQLAVTCKEQVEKQGSGLSPGGVHTFALKSRVADFQSNKRHLLNAVGERVFQVFEELEEQSLRPARTALLGSSFPELYPVARNRLVFLDNPNDAGVHLEHYVMLGHFVEDRDDEERVWELVAQLLREQGLVGSRAEELAGLERQRAEKVEQLQGVNRRLREAERAAAEGAPQVAPGSRKLRWLGVWKKSPPSRQTLPAPEGLAETLESERAALASQLEELERRIAFLRQEEEAGLSELLSNPASAERLFGTLSPTGAPPPATPAQKALLQQLYTRLERAGMLKHILASYHLRPFYKEFCPPLNPQQLKHAVVGRRGWEQFEVLLDQFPTQNFPVEKLEELARRLRRLDRSDAEALLLRFAHDLMRLRRDKLHRQHLLALLEKINLLEDEKTRRISRLNRTLYEFLLPEERPAGEAQVLSHVVVKADVRDSTGITDQLLGRGLNPATHFSFNFYEPVRKLMARYAAAKIFIEGDALILGLYETEVNRAGQRPVAKACLLAKEIVQVCQVYNQRARANELPVLELGLGIAYHPAPPHYWDDGESRLLISPALNQSDRLAGCTRLARKLVGENRAPFHVFQLQGYSVLGGAEEDEELLVRYNVMGVALNDEGFQKLREEISLSPLRMSADLLGQKESITLHCGTVPLGESFERLMIREARVPRILLPSGHIQEWTSRPYFEVCVSPEVYEKFPAGD